jgi:hypothetical protein
MGLAEDQQSIFAPVSSDNAHFTTSGGYDQQTMSSRRAIQLFTPAARLTCPALPLLPSLSHSKTVSHKAGRRRLAQRAVSERPKVAVHERGRDTAREVRFLPTL